MRLNAFASVALLVLLVLPPAHADGLINMTDMKALLAARASDSKHFDATGDSRIGGDEFFLLGRSFGAIGSGVIEDTDAGTGFYDTRFDDTAVFPITGISVTLESTTLSTAMASTATIAFATYSNGDTLDIRSYLRFASTDTNAIRVSSKQVSAAGVGAAFVTARFGGVSGGTVTVTVPLTSRFNSVSPLGTNMDRVNYFSSDHPFVDAFKSSRVWQSVPDTMTVDLNETGWVRSLQSGQYVTTSVFVGIPNNNYPGGRYYVLYDGVGLTFPYLTYGGGAVKTGASTGRDTLSVTPTANGIIINVVSIDPANPIRNIRLIMPGGISTVNPYRWCVSDTDCSSGTYVPFDSNYATQIFHPTFLDRLKTYRFLRFIEWGMINGSAIRNWSDRARTYHARWSLETGVPIEIMCDLANRLQSDAWFGIPHRATDDYISNHAALARDSLASHLKAYVEHSNEVWNTQFTQNLYAQQQGIALALSADSNEAQRLYHSRRSKEIFTLWQTAFGGTSRLTRVISGFVNDTPGSRQILAYQNAYLSTDALAIAPYLGGYLGTPQQETWVQNLTTPQIMTELLDTELPRVLSRVASQKTMADSYSVALIAYEAGQHLSEQDSVVNNNLIHTLFNNANRDAQMGALYTNYLNGWRAAGGRDLLHFVNCYVWNTQGRWGALEYPSQPRASSQKFNALQTFIEFNSKWW